MGDRKNSDKGGRIELPVFKIIKGEGSDRLISYASLVTVAVSK